MDLRGEVEKGKGGKEVGEKEGKDGEKMPVTERHMTAMVDQCWLDMAETISR